MELEICIFMKCSHSPVKRPFCGTMNIEKKYVYHFKICNAVIKI